MDNNIKNSLIFKGVEYRVVDIKKESVWGYVEKIKADDGEVLGYKVLDNIAYYSQRYEKWIGVEKGDRSDGATYAKDLTSFSWIFHDELCNDGKFEGGVKCNNWQASTIVYDILKSEGYWFRARTWRYSTWLGGGGKARKNGMF